MTAARLYYAGGALALLGVAAVEMIAADVQLG